MAKTETAVFKGEDFTGGEFFSGDDKAKFANHLLEFVARDFPDSMWSDEFYKRLSMTFSHIAHFNKDGFASLYFRDDEAKAAFLSDTCEGGGYGDPAYTFSDVEIALKPLLKPYLRLYEERAAEAREAGERATYERLRLKYEPGFEGP